jgi:pimeloyl-ACP methyl ester carboxylesterase
VTTFALIHGAWGSGWHWATIPERLRDIGHDVVAPDLPCEDPGATFDDYAQVVLDALSAARDDDVGVVGYSLGGHTAALVAARRPVRELIYLAAMIPEPGMSLNDQFARGDRMLFSDYIAGIEGPDEAGISRWVDFDVYHRTSCHDCEEPTARERFARSRGQSIRPYGSPCSLTTHPRVPTRYLLCTEDGLMNNEFWRPALHERLDVEIVAIPGSHSPMVSRPEDLVDFLVAGESGWP